MEPLHASGPQPQLARPVADAAIRILLLDCDPRRRELRAEALLDRGVLVDRAAESLIAKALWKPGTYDLVLVELRGADADCAAFISFVEAECPRQKFGFYVAQPPYVTASAEARRSSLQKQKPHQVVGERRQSDDPARRPDGTGLLVATQRITAARQLARIQAQTPEEPRMPVVREEDPQGIPASDAVTLARRVLGGS